MTQFGTTPWLSNPKFRPQPRKPAAPIGEGWPDDFMAALAAAEQRGYDRGRIDGERAAVDRAIAIADAMDSHGPTVVEIAKEVAEKYGLDSWRLLRAKRRNRHIVAARHEAMYRASKETDRTLVQIGWVLGRFDHTTVIHGIRKHEERMKEACHKNAIDGT